MARAGLGDDLLLANETVDPARLKAMAALGAAGDDRDRLRRHARRRRWPPVSAAA